jgi:hypothetical protein
MATSGQAANPQGGNPANSAPGSGSSSTSQLSTINNGSGILGSQMNSANNGTASSGVTPAATPTMTGVAPVTAPNYSATQTNPDTTPLANTSQSKAATWGVTPDQLTSNQLAGILQSNSPLMGQASLQADQATAARGLLNSSMTAGAEEQSMINSALPVAQANAQTLAAAGAQNAQEQTQANLATAAQGSAASQQQVASQEQERLANASAANTAGQFNAQANITAQQSNQQASLSQATTTFNAAFQSNTQAVDSATKLGLQTLANQSAQTVASLNGSYSLAMQTTNTYGSAYSSLQTSIADVLKNTTDPTAAQNQIGDLIASFQSAMQPLQDITGLNLASNFTAVPGGGTSPGLVPNYGSTTPNSVPAPASNPAAAPAPAAPPTTTTPGAGSSPNSLSGMGGVNELFGGNSWRPTAP